MSEHTYRLLLGSLLLILLYTEFYFLAYIVVAMTLFEGLTNQRLNLVINRLLRKQGPSSSDFDTSNQTNYRVSFDAERAQRLFIAVTFSILFFAAPKELWMINWFFAFGMVISGIVMFCPVIALFRAIGFR